MGQHRQFPSMCLRLYVMHTYTRHSSFNSIQLYMSACHWYNDFWLQFSLFLILNSNWLELLTKTRTGRLDTVLKIESENLIWMILFSGVGNCAVADRLSAEVWMWNQRATAITCQFLRYTLTKIKHTSAAALDVFVFSFSVSFSLFVH